ncbi:hypothetical protein [Sandaracinus amylolyticus]|uniref:hypothetical protein n=1 Tax=Sandaracinus amylolyticus TaxID=927083 RepID=UPI001F186859|nr:hypothetical protein [Sandaracinus amylolyticus]
MTWRIAWVLVVLLAACDRPTVASTPLESWCVSLETALRDRHLLCECDGEPLSDEALTARCESMNAQSLQTAVDAGEVLWNGALATSIIRSLDDCERAQLLDDPVIGEVQVGEPCRVFTDVAGVPDDCELGARCMAPLGGGELRCSEIPTCTSDDDCLAGRCLDGACATPVCEAEPRI